MTSRHVAPMVAGAVLLSSLAFVPAAAQTSSSTASQTSRQRAAQVTLVGCLQREADYRRAHDLGKGGTAGTGLGSGDEYVLVNASRVEGSAAAAPTADCTSQGSGDAYELTGSREHDLRSLVGHVVQITGTLTDSMVNVASFQEVAPAAAGATPPPVPQPPRPSRQPDNLPRTASRLPLIALIGLLSLGAAIGLRARRGI